MRAADGTPIKAIAAALGVSASSVSRWVRDIELTEEQHARLREANPIYNAQLRGRAGRSRSERERRVLAQAHGRRLARAGDALHRQGCMLYWAEGSKTRNVVAFTNSDADMMRVFLRFLRECYAVPDERVALAVNCHLNNGLALEDIERWWLLTLGLPAASLRASSVNRLSQASSGRRNTLPYGTARLAVYSTQIVQSIYGAIQEYAGIERPEWLG